MPCKPGSTSLDFIILGCRVSQYIAELVAPRFHQVRGFDFHETFSPIVKPTTIRLITTLVLASNWELFQFYVDHVFLDGLFDEIVYVVQHPRFEVEEKYLIHKLNKTPFGLKQAPRQWLD